MSSETLSANANRNSEKAVNPAVTSLESMAGKFNPDAARELQNAVKNQTLHEGTADSKETNIDKGEKSELDSPIDYSCFDKLNDAGFDNLPEKQRAEVLDWCEQAYDASLEQFAKLGDFHDPDNGHHLGVNYHDGIDGAKRGVNYIVSCQKNVEYYSAEINKLEAKLAEYSGFHLFGRKKYEDAKRKISNELRESRTKLEYYQAQPDRIGQRAFGSAEKWQSDEIQSKYKHMIQMRKDIDKVKYPWSNDGNK